MIVGQNSHSRFCGSMIMAVLQSGNPGRSAIKNGGVHSLAFFGKRAP
jgi:hypothetical protein